jgi:parallel beta-helix repeat protein
MSKKTIVSLYMFIPILIFLLILWAPIETFSSPTIFSAEQSQPQCSSSYNIHKTIVSASKKQYTTHAPIVIENNTDFSTQALTEGWDGDGSQEDPYIISGLEIKNSIETLITIKDTDFYFEISNNNLDGISTIYEKRRVIGISISNVSHSKITDNIIKNTRYGIDIQQSFNITITDNMITNFSHKGVYIFNSLNNTISRNTISDNVRCVPGMDWTFYGSIHIRRSHNNCIFENVLTKMGFIGLNLDTSFDNLVYKNQFTTYNYAGTFTASISALFSENNTIENNKFTGTECGYQEAPGTGPNEITNNTFSNHYISLELQSGTVVSQNNISGSSEYAIGVGYYGINAKAVAVTIKENIICNNKIGIILEYSEEASVLNNSIYSNTLYGINISAVSNNNVIKWNDFLANNLDGDSQALDNGTENSFTSNYWYEWTKPDSDENGITDNPYRIDGEAENTDPSPQVSRMHPDSPPITAPSKSTPGWSFVLTLITWGIILVYRRKKKIL